MIDYRLNQEQLEQIHWGMRHSPRAEVRQRSTAIHLLHCGHKPGEVSERMAVSLGSIYKWHKRWREEGLSGLANRAKSGRPKKADRDYCQLLEALVERGPSAYGYDFGLWTADRLRAHLSQETGIQLSNRRFRVLLKELGLVYRRPKHDLTSLQDAAEKQRGQALLDWLKKDVAPKSSSSSLWTKPA